MPYYVNGTATDEQDLVGQLDTFLTGTIGTWVKIDTVTDTAATKDLVFRSPGNGEHRQIYLRFLATGNSVYIYGYSGWRSSVDYDGQLHSAIYSRMGTGTGNINYWFFGDIDYVWIVAEDSVGNYIAGHGGLLDSYHSAEDDDLPLVIIGCINSSYSMTGTNRTYMYSALVSGTNIMHKAYNTHTPLLAYGDPSDRNANVEAHTPFIIYNDVVGHKEVRGELRGALYFSGTSFSSGDWVTISGTDMSYFVRSISASNCEAFGPVVTG